MSENVKNNLSMDLWRELSSTFEIIGKSHNKRMSNFNLTTPQYNVLDTLSAEGKMSLKTISQRLNVTGANITCVMDNLEKRNYAERIPSKDDRRIINAELTQEGEKMVKKLTPLYLESINEETKKLSDNEKKTLIKLLSKLKK